MGNKLDKIESGEATREVSLEEARQFARELNIDWIETSAKSSQFVENMFRRVCLSVAILLPPVKVHLDLAGLPDGWLAVMHDAADAAIEPDLMLNNSSKHSSSGGEIRSLDISNLEKATANRENSISRESSASRAASIISIDISRTKYVNYWTDVSQNDRPRRPADPSLLYMANADLEKRQLQIGEAETEVSSSFKSSVRSSKSTVDLDEVKRRRRGERETDSKQFKSKCLSHFCIIS